MIKTDISLILHKINFIIVIFLIIFSFIFQKEESKKAVVKFGTGNKFMKKSDCCGGFKYVARFEKMALEDLKRQDKGSENVTDKKYFLVFHTELKMYGMDYKAQVSQLLSHSTL